MHNNHLTGKVALVTGATQGIGRAIAARLAEEGCSVAINGRQLSERMSEAVSETGGIAAPANISDAAQVADMIAEIERKLGPIDIFVANAAQMSMAPFLEQNDNQWWEQIDVNLTGHIDCIHHIIPAMRKKGKGHIIIISSNFGVLGWKNASGYAASKAGLMALGRYFAYDLSSYGIEVSVISPGVIDTPQLQVDADDLNISLEEVHAYYAKSIPAGRIGRAEEVAATVAFLLKDNSRGFSGQLIQINGGDTRCTYW
jgi:NAD(P)-dependent dehydrogenase (short-subunit alcohol dehydrogenase family)